MSKVEQYKEAVESIMGERLDMKSREPRFVAGRMCIAYQLLNEGNGISAVGRAIGKDHATICHIRKQMEMILQLPKVYRDESALWERFKERIETINA